ncbi:HAMP domain-containing histidine kinase [Faecalicatena sp. AGMB00832]|uniref:histidine kinase n=1 Tax=Faecalicatena faecalis TaxID=2726362 RepID=A0ABS6D1E1_9FIRM|nr:HAMP domain-containing sensor histidine kinase [Faecalicatena faecalis]MBU3875402.1 HAMP domain-containing histidine kinase [Faecalicatena faecalis]
MSGRKNILVTVGLVLSVSFICSAFAVMLTAHYDSRMQFDLLNSVCGEVLEQDPGAEKIISAALKEYTGGNADGTAKGDVLSALGYRISDFSKLQHRGNYLFVAAGALAGFLLLTVTLLYRNKKEAVRIQALAEYLEQANTGKAVILSTTGEDDFSKLEDEIYKTVTFLYQTKEEAVQARNGFAENLSNIAHQIKTPITAISLSLQTMQKDNSKNKSEQIQKQLLRLSHLEEALLVLSRLDAGTLIFQKEEVDVFTILVLASDNLQELLTETGTYVDIPELGGMAVSVDLDWTMEAVMNLMKNCMEHHPGGTIHCIYEQNPLYTEIKIWDEGEGFLKEDIPYLFERFYRGHNAHEGGIGIGLALAKEIIERQNGTIRASNKKGAGACFEIRFYSH